MKQRTHFLNQFGDVAPQKQARRERFMRKVAGKRQHLQARLRRPQRLRPAHRLD